MNNKSEKTLIVEMTTSQDICHRGKQVSKSFINVSMYLVFTTNNNNYWGHTKK